MFAGCRHIESNHNITTRSYNETIMHMLKTHSKIINTPRNEAGVLVLIALGELDAIKSEVKNGLDILGLIGDRDMIELVSPNRAGLEMLAYLKDLALEAAIRKS